MVSNKGNSVDLLNTNHLDKGNLLNYNDEYSNFSLKGFNLLHPFAERGHINIKNIDWTKKEVSYELILQGKAMGIETVSFGKNSIAPYSVKNKKFTFSINSQSKDSESVMGLTLYEGLLDGINTAKYDSITLDAKMIFFNKKTVLENFIKNGENILNTLGKDKGNVVDAQVINKAYINSGTKLSFKDWAAGEGKDTVNKITNILNQTVNKNVPSGNTPPATKNNNTNNNTPKNETTILGMSPVVFGVTALGVVVVASLASIWAFKKWVKKTN